MGQDARAAALGLALVLATGWTFAASAQQDSFCGIDLDRLASDGVPASILFGSDDRQPIVDAALPWRAIGALVTPFNQCSGTLVDGNLVLTAAHCVSDYLRRDMVPGDVRFYAGLQDGSYLASARAVRIVTASDRPVGPGFDGAFNDDWAFVVLDSPIGASVGTLPVFDLGDAGLAAIIRDAVPVHQAGYSADRPDRLTAHLGCRLYGYHPDGWVEHDCDTVPGDSGSPILLQNGRETAIIAVASAVECPLDGATPRNTAVDARAFYQAYRDLLRSARVAVQVPAPGVVRREPGPGHGSGPRIIAICETDC